MSDLPIITPDDPPIVLIDSAGRPTYVHLGYVISRLYSRVIQLGPFIFYPSGNESEEELAELKGLQKGLREAVEFLETIKCPSREGSNA